MYTTAFSTLLAFIGSVSAGQLYQSIEFVLKHPDALWFILALSASSAVVQVGLAGRAEGGACLMLFGLFFLAVYCTGGACMMCLQPCRVGSLCDVSGTAWRSVCSSLPVPAAHHQLHHQALWGSGVCHHYDHASVCVHPALIPRVLDAPPANAVVSSGGLQNTISIVRPGSSYQRH